MLPAQLLSGCAGLVEPLHHLHVDKIRASTADGAPALPLAAIAIFLAVAGAVFWLSEQQARKMNVGSRFSG